MKKLFIFLCALTLSIPALAADQKESAYARVMRTGTLRCGYTVWAPYITKDPVTGKIGGLIYDVTEALGKTLNLKIEWDYEYVFGTQVEALRSNKVDALCYDGPWTRSAMPFLDYTHGSMFGVVYPYVRASDTRFDSKDGIEKLNDKKITMSVMDGDLSLDLAGARFPNAKLLEVPATADPTSISENVATRKADVVILDPLSAAGFNKTRTDKLKPVQPDTPLAIYPDIISLPKGQQDLLNMLNQGIDFLTDTGQIAPIIRRYDPELKNIFPPQNRYAR